MARERNRASHEHVGGMRNETDRRGAVEVLCRAFSSPAWMEDHLERGLWRGGTFDPEHTRIVVDGGRVMAAVVMAPRRVRFGPVAVPAMTLGPVGTHDRFRKRGYAAAAMNDASRYMAANGYLLGYLQGIANFYHRFGYYPYRCTCAAKFERADAQPLAAPARARTMRRSDLPAVRRLYARVTAGRVMAADRDAKVWDWLVGSAGRTWMFHRPQVVCDAAGHLCGYFTVHPRTGNVSELLAAPEERAARVMLGALCRRSRRREEKEIKLPLPWDEPLAVFLRQHVRATWEMSSNPTGGQLLKIVDFPALMRRLQPLLSQRWRNRRPPGNAAVRFTLASELGAVGISATPAGVKVADPLPGRRVRIPQRWLSGLLTGYHAPRDIAPRQGAAIPPSLLPALDSLFPRAWPFIHQGDNY